MSLPRKQKQAIKILEAHNRWRRGEDVEPMVEPTEIGDAIDVVVEYVKNNIVLDPFSGSGTVLLESAINNRNSIGFDISTIATCISKAKVSNFNKKKKIN